MEALREASEATLAACAASLRPCSAILRRLSAFFAAAELDRKIVAEEDWLRYGVTARDPLTFAAVLAVIFKPGVGMGQLIMQTQMHRRTT